ncbi:MAG: DUF4446 family protein [Anaerolineae bacterium]|nr:DUF4446 family protein [Anaerolineae bacterium]
MSSLLTPWVIASTILLFVAAYWIYNLEKRLNDMDNRYQRLLTVSQDIDQVTVTKLLAKLDEMNEKITGLERHQDQIATVLPHTIQGLGITRFSAFEGVGGDQSFALALLDEHGNGAILTGLHSGSDTRVYGKPVQQFRSSYSLSADEQDALGKAKIALGGAKAQPENDIG